MEAGSTGRLIAITIIVLVAGKILAAVLKARSRYVRVKRLMDSQGIRGPPPSSWIAGNAVHSSQIIEDDMPTIHHNCVSQIWPYHAKCLKDYGSNVYLSWNFGLQPVLNIANAQISFEIQTRVSERPQAFKKIIDSVFGRGIFNASVKEWVGQRAQLTPAFHADKIKNMVETMVSCVNLMLEDWDQKVDATGASEIDVGTAMVDVTADIIGQTAFGAKGEVNRKCVHLLDELEHQIMRQAPFVTLIPGYRYFPTKENLLERRMNKELYDILSKIIHSRLNEAQAGSNSFGHDMLGLLLSATVPANRMKIDISYLVDECKNFYLAGHETSAHLLTWSMFLLALHPEWQHRAREEVRSLQGTHTSEPNKLKIVGMIISESLRLYPIAPQIVRETTEDVQVKSKNRKILIPEGTIVLIDTLTIHYDKELWGDNADEFQPERFASPVEGGSGKYLPFGLGPRMCLGRAFALVELKLVMAMILDKFEWSLSPSYRHAPMMRFTIYPRHGMPLIISRAKH